MYVSGFMGNEGGLLVQPCGYHMIDYDALNDIFPSQNILIIALLPGSCAF